MGSDELNVLAKGSAVRLQEQASFEGRRKRTSTRIDCGSGCLGTGVLGTIGFRSIKTGKPRKRSASRGAFRLGGDDDDA